MRVAIIGYGAVAAIHARQLAADPAVRLSAVCGPEPAKARAFAGTHGIEKAVSSLPDVIPLADAAVICSPSAVHFEQARVLLQAGVSALLELPACNSRQETDELAAIAASRGMTLHCAHTSRYMEPYRRLGALLGEKTLGEVRQVHVVRTISPRQRSWTDDALLHHAAHPLHLLLHWFPGLQLLGCAAHPQPVGAQHVAILAALPNGGPVSVNVSYHARVAAADFLVVGERHSFSTDGFSRIVCDLPGQAWRGDADAEYHAAIRTQDLEFLSACRGADAGVPWAETTALAAAIDRLRQMR